MKRDQWYVVDTSRKVGSAILRVRYEWMARLATCKVARRLTGLPLDYGKAGTF